MRHLFVVLAALLLTACSKGLDRELVTGEGAETYRASLNIAFEEMSEEERAAFNWAVSDFDIDRVHAEYPNASLRRVIRGEVQTGLERWPQQLAVAEAERVQFDAVADELRKVQAERVRFSLRRDFHGLQPTIEAVLLNDSKHGISSLRWRASLFLDGSAEPIAVATLYDDYNSSAQGYLDDESAAASEPGGMRPGMRYARTFTVGFVTGSEEWITLAVQNASQRVVKLEPVLESITDYNEDAILGDSPYETIRLLSNSIETAKAYEHY